MTPHDIIAQVDAGVLTPAEADAALERLQVRGDWKAPEPLAPYYSYCGYDYRTQRWIVTGVYDNA